LRTKEEQFLALSVNPEVNLEVDRSEHQTLNRPAMRERCQVPESARGLDDWKHGSAGGLNILDPLGLRQHDARDSGRAADGNVVAKPFGAGAIDAYKDGVLGGKPARHILARRRPLGGGDRVFQIDDHRVRAAGIRFGEAVRPVPGNE